MSGGLRTIHEAVMFAANVGQRRVTSQWDRAPPSGSGAPGARHGEEVVVHARFLRVESRGVPCSRIDKPELPKMPLWPCYTT